MNKNSTSLAVFVAFAFVSWFFPHATLASSTDGTIDSTYKYAWSENLGWINMGTSEGNIHVTDDALTGYAWNEHTGWIILNSSSTVYVSNNSEGTLAGYAWGEGIGYIDFTGVTIDSSGFFHGYASSSLGGRISFNCENNDTCGTSDFRTKTDWRKASVRAIVPPGTNSPGSVTDYSTAAFVQFPAVPSTSRVLRVATSSSLSTLPASTLTKNQASSTCPIYLKKYIKLGKKNDAVEVRKLQNFLAQYEGFPNLKVTGIYDQKTYDATLQFQKKYVGDILGPWNHAVPTGYVYKTTLKKVNELYCGYQSKQ